MKILVAVKRVPDPSARLTLTSEGQLDLSGVHHVVNPWDEIALDSAFRLKELGVATEIIAISIAPEAEASAWEETLRAALARAADRAILVPVTDEEMRPETVAHRIAEVARRVEPDAILFGKQGSDSDDGQTGPLVAGKFNWPLLSAVTEIYCADGLIKAAQEAHKGTEITYTSLPVVITRDLGTRAARPIPLPAILKAKSKPLERILPESSPLPASSTVYAYNLPPVRLPCRMVNNVEELVKTLVERGIVSEGMQAEENSKPLISDSEDQFVETEVDTTDLWEQRREEDCQFVGTEAEADTLAWLSGHWKMPLIRGVIEAWEEDNHYRYRRTVHSGRLQQIVDIPKSKPHIIIVAGEHQRTGNQKFAISSLISSQKFFYLPPVKRMHPGQHNKRPELNRARTIVAGGRGLRDAEAFDRLAGGLAESLGGAVAASGGASNTGIAPAQIVIGQSGKYVAPDLYIALGISGADQHVAGFKDAKTVVAINTDPNAPIFRFADIGLVADLNTAVPEWIARVGK